MGAALTERLEIRVDTTTLRLLEAEAHRRGVSVGALVREAIRRLLQEDTTARRNAVAALARLSAPTSDWETMKREIEVAYLAPLIEAALAALLEIEPGQVWENLIERSPMEREQIAHEAFRQMTAWGQLPHPPALYEAPFKNYIAARLREVTESRRGSFH